MKIGATNATKAYLGATEATKLYLGSVLVLDNTFVISNLYTYINAVSDDDINSNADWSGTSTYFANSIVSTDVGQNYSISIETRNNGTDGASLNHTLPILSIGTEYKATIRYKNNTTVVNVSTIFFNWTNVSGATYPTTVSTGNWVEVDVIFTPTVAQPIMRSYPHSGNGVRTTGDVLEISSIIIVENT